MRAARMTGGLTALGLVLASVTLPSAAFAEVGPGAPVVINEVYGGGGNTGATWTRDFVELVNVSGAPVDVTGWAVQYASATGTGAFQVTPLSGEIPAGGYLLVGEALGAGGTQTFEADVDGSIPMSGTGGKVALTATVAGLPSCGTPAACTAPASLVDFVGWGSANGYAGAAAAPATTNPTSVSRDATHTNTADNAADFTAGAPTPQGSGTGEDPQDPTDPAVVPIAEIQGTGAASPLVNQTVTTEGVVTAAYPTGGYGGYVIQTAGTGGAPGAASHAIFVYSAATVGSVEIGAHVRVTGAVSEFRGLTEITVVAGGLEVLTQPAAPVTPVASAWPASDAEREPLESMLVVPQGPFTVSDTYPTNQYGEVGLAAGTTVVVQPTEAGPPGSPEAAAAATDAAARGVVLADGSSYDLLRQENRGLTPAYLSLDDPVRVGAPVTFTGDPLVVDYRNNLWLLNPVGNLLDNSAPVPATFASTRTVAPGPVGGDLTVATFNVLNYFTTLGADTPGCVSYDDRAGDPVTVRGGCDPRGAWDPDDLVRQQDKIVAAINGLDADVVGLLEIENSLVVDGVPDEALATLVAALNTEAGAGTWAYVPSSTELPAPEAMDVITNAIIYRPAAVTRSGESRALGTASAEDQAFGNAREPIAQEFVPVAGGEPFLVVVNHFKSKGSAGPWPGDTDQGDGQGAGNVSRTMQAEVLRDWVASIASPDEAVLLTGDFNSYTHEDPLAVLYDAGYADAVSQLAPGQYSYSFDGLAGSLDHVLLNGPALDRVTGADIWGINAEESVALEYSRFNYHGTLFYADDQYRSSDHDPVLVGLEKGRPASTTVLTARPQVQKAGSPWPTTLAATVRTGQGRPAAGTVEFVVDGEVVATAGLWRGVATVTVPAGAVGTRSAVAHYVGTDALAPSTSAPVTLTVEQVRTWVFAHATSPYLSQRAWVPTFVVATVGSDGFGVPAGTVEVREGDRLVARSRVTGPWPVWVPLPNDESLGTHRYDVAFVPDDAASVAGSTSAWPVVVTVRR